VNAINKKLKKFTSKFKLERKHTIPIFEFIGDVGNEQKYQLSKKLLDRRHGFTILYLTLVAGLSIITYWDFPIAGLCDPYFLLAVTVPVLVIVCYGWKIRKARIEQKEERLKRLKPHKEANQKNESASK